MIAHPRGTFGRRIVNILFNYDQPVTFGSDLQNMGKMEDEREEGKRFDERLRGKVCSGEESPKDKWNMSTRSLDAMNTRDSADASAR